MSQLPTSLVTVLLYLFFTFFLTIKTTCTTPCTTSTCGNTEIRYPFWLQNSSTTTTNQLCGYPGFGVVCTTSSNTSILPLSNNNYDIKSIDYSNYTITLVDTNVTANLTCPTGIGCHNISLEGIPLFYNVENLNAANVTNGFLLDWRASLECEICEISRGLCGYNNSTNQREFLCFCQDGTITNGHCRGAENGRGVTRLIYIVTIPIVTIFAILIIGFCIHIKHQNASVLSRIRRKNKDVQKLEALIKQSGFTVPRRYTYSDIIKITNSFQEKIGKGGHGDVYKGYLCNGHPVAVKVTKLSGDEFINEVASISTTSHVNIVSLLGFCLEGKKCAQIFEYMANGSLEKYIHKESNSLFGMEDLYKIAVGVARGLLYLHNEHNSMVHLDIKPQNVLLDEGFCPKISDFGLAIICDKKESLLAQLKARGTIGYIAPEVFTSTLGIISGKSDVYSYGMMILEMIGARNNPTGGGRSNTTSETYFPDWVYQRVTVHNVKNNNLEADALINEDNELERKMLLVGLWCIQTDPLDRPDSEKVVEMLEGSIECIEIPPKPELPSPSAFQKAGFMTTSVESNFTTLSSFQTSTGDYTKEHKVDITKLSESYSSNVSLPEVDRVDSITWPR